MASDMSKKPSVFTDGQTKKKGPYLQQQTKTERIYSTVYECVSKSEWSRGLRLSLMSQVPFTAMMLTSFSMTNSMLEKQEKFHKYDDLTFIYKFMTRFGAMTIATTLASTVCYPIDTIKRRL